MALTNIDGKLVEDLSGFYPMGYGLYGAMGRSEGIMPSESSSYEEYNEDGDENSVEGEGEESGLGIEAADLPRFRQLVREKKLKLKAQYGKTKWYVTERWGCPIACGPGVGGEANWFQAGLHPNKTRKVSGWRKQWKNFKSSGGLAQLKLQSKGLTPIPTTTPPTTTTPTTTVPTTTVPSFSNINIKPMIKPVVIKGTLPTTTTAIEEEEEVVAKLGDKNTVMKIAFLVTPLIFVIIAIGAYMILRKK